MKKTILTLALLVSATAAQGACFVEYKAKKDDPLELHYGIIEVSDPCTADHSDKVVQRLADHNWKLLTIISTFASPPTKKQTEDAGDHFLRY